MGLGAVSDWSDWGASFVDTTYDQPVYSETILGDIAVQGQAQNTGGGDNWTGFFQEAGKALLGYAVSKDAAETQASLSTQVKQPVYAAAQVQQRQGNNMLLIVGAVVVAVLVLK